MESVIQPQQSEALTEGRRIYLGNLLYSVMPADIEALLKELDLGHYERIHISVDPISGRNPGYCFVEFNAREDAERALTALDGAAIYNRIVKVGPCHPKSSSRDSIRRPEGTERTSSSSSSSSTFQRWGDWNGEKRAAKPNEQGPYGALHHLGEMRALPEGRRLYVGGLGPMADQGQNDQELRELFAGTNIPGSVAIGKRITPHPSTREKPGNNHHYCFIDFASEEDAEKAMKATSGKPYSGGFLRVSLAKGKMPTRDSEDGPPANDFVRPPPQRSTRGSYQASSPAGRTRNDPAEGRDERGVREERDGRQRVIMAASSWRRGPDPATQ
ncbi:hypothetical protein B0H67DRAFT_548749 [Lasiosphaeris hirsuta]|uniref:RRM domain-containing protein n=1 Tax=Lasiosphaeris hirsuta TaxID=260670 RepID=A0AA40E8K2_9PEZI|nr:hypothetical protein B0H67DRAFT_548749 [Lasiosphaeris hirsuta]